VDRITTLDLRAHLVTRDAEVLAVKHFRGAQIVDLRRFLEVLRAR